MDTHSSILAWRNDWNSLAQMHTHTHQKVKMLTQNNLLLIEAFNFQNLDGLVEDIQILKVSFPYQYNAVLIIISLLLPWWLRE